MGHARQAGRPRPDGQGFAERAQGPEPRIGGRRAGAGPHERHRRDDSDHGAGPPVIGQRIRGYRRAGQSRRFDHPSEGRGAHFARSLLLQHRERYQRRERRRLEYQHASRCQRHGGRRFGQEGHGGDPCEFPGGNQLRDSVRHDHLYFRVDPPRLPDAF